jgi:hypothetical protein
MSEVRLAPKLMREEVTRPGLLRLATRFIRWTLYVCLVVGITAVVSVLAFSITNALLVASLHGVFHRDLVWPIWLVWPYVILLILIAIACGLGAAGIVHEDFQEVYEERHLPLEVRVTNIQETLTGALTTINELQEVINRQRSIAEDLEQKARTAKSAAQLNDDARRAVQDLFRPELRREGRRATVYGFLSGVLLTAAPYLIHYFHISLPFYR